MKKVSFLFITTTLALLFFNACNPEDNQTGEYKKYSSLTPEEHKNSMQTIAINMIGEVSDLAFSKGVKTSATMVSLMESGNKSFTQKAKTVYPVQIMYGVSRLQSNPSSVYDLMLSLKNYKEDDVNNPKTIQQQFDEICGVYKWNFTKEKFDTITKGGKTLVIEFPSDSAKTTNNAKFSVNTFQTQVFEKPVDMESPVEINASLTIDGAKEIELTLTASYNAKGIPLSVDQSLTVSGYTFTSKLENDATKKASVEYAFKKGSTKIMGVSAGANGAFTEADITKNTHYYEEYFDETTYQHVTREITKDQMNKYENRWYWEEVDFEEILQKGYGFIDMLDLRVGGEVNVKSLVDSMKVLEDKVDDSKTYTNEMAMDDMVIVLNNNTDFYAAYNSDKKKIADLEFYSYLKDYDLIEWRPVDSVYKDMTGWGYWQYTYGEVKVGTEKRKTIGGRFVFGDGSKIDAETYFKDGFDKLIAEINNFAKDLEKEYGIDMGEIEIK